MLEIGARPAEFEPTRARNAIDHDLGCTLVEYEIGVGHERVDAEDFGVEARAAAGLVAYVGMDCGVVELRCALPLQVTGGDYGNTSILTKLAAQLSLGAWSKYPKKK